MNIEEKNIKNELLYFKDEVLKDVRLELSKFTSKMDNQNDAFSEKVTSLQNKIGALSEKIINISNSISEDKTLKDKITKLAVFKQKTEDKLSFHDSKINFQSKMIIDAINRIDHFINDSILYNDVIGPTPNCKFQNFHKFIDYIISNITQLNTFKEKTISMDIRAYKSKIDSSLETLRTQIGNISKGNNNYAQQLAEEQDEKIKGLFRLYDDKIVATRMENNKYVNNMKTSFENMQKEWEKIILINNEMNEKIKNEREDISKMNKYLEEKMELFQMQYLEHKATLNKSIEEIYNKIKQIKIKIGEISANNKNSLIKENQGQIKEINQGQIKEINKGEIKGSFNGQNIERKIENNKEKKIEDKSEENFFEIEEKIDEKSISKKIGNESPLKQYIEGKLNYEQVSHFKQKKTQNIENKKFVPPKISSVDDYITKTRQMSYFEMVNNILNNQRIKDIYDTNNKDVQNFIDKIIIGSVISSHIKKYDNLNQFISNDQTKNIENEKNLKPMLKSDKNSDLFRSKFKFNEYLKIDEQSHSTNKENINTSNNDNIYDKIFDKIKENINNINNNYKNNSNRMTLNQKNWENYFNKDTGKHLYKGKNTSHSQISIFNNDNFDKEKKLNPPINIKKMTLIKKTNSNDELNKNASLDLENNNDSNINNMIEKINNKFKENIIKDNKKEENQKLINIKNFSNKSQSLRFFQKKNKSQTDFFSNVLENKPEKLKIKRNIVIKHDKNSIKNNFGVRNLTNQMSKNNLLLYDSASNSRHNKNKLEIIAVKQIEKSIKNMESPEN